MIEYHLNLEAKELFDGEIELDESYFGGIRNGKRVLRKYNGIDKKHFHLFIKECKFRFNYGTPSQKLKTLRKWCGI